MHPRPMADTRSLPSVRSVIMVVPSRASLVWRSRRATPVFRYPRPRASFHRDGSSLVGRIGRTTSRCIRGLRPAGAFNPHPRPTVTEQETLLAAVLEDPSDDTARLVLADLLRESDDPEARALGRFLWAGVTASRFRDAEPI